MFVSGQSVINIKNLLFVGFSLQDNICNGGQCHNTQGSFSCVCNGGLMMGPDATSCLDLDECIINPDVRRSFTLHLERDDALTLFRFVKMENVSTCSDPTTVFVMTASQYTKAWRKAALMMTNVCWISTTVTPSLNARTPMGRMTASAGRASLGMASTVRSVRENISGKPHEMSN